MLLFGNDRYFILLHLVPKPNMYFIAAPSFITNLQITVQFGEMHCKNFFPSFRFVFTAVASVGSPFRTGLILGHLASLVMLLPFERSVYNFKYTNFEKRCFLGCLTNINLVFLA